jgi:hypothetical protein
MRMWPCFRPIRLFAVVQMHPVFNEAGTVVEMQKGLPASCSAIEVVGVIP